MEKNNFKTHVSIAVVVFFSLAIVIAHADIIDASGQAATSLPITNGASTSSVNSVENLQNNINSATQKISQLAVGSIAANSFKIELQDIQAIEADAAGLGNADNLKAQDEISTAQSELKKLDQLIDVANGSESGVVEGGAIGLQNLRQGISSLQDEINKIITNNGDVASLKSGLLEIETQADSAQAKMDADDEAGANVLMRQARGHLNSLDDSADGTLDISYDGSRKTIRDYSMLTLWVSQDLDSLANVDSKVGPQLLIIAKSQHDSIANVDELVGSVAARSGLVKFFIGANTGCIKKLSDQVEENKKNIETLKTIESQITDPAEGAVLQTEIQTIQQQTATLEVYIQINEGGYSLFGWFLRYL